MNWLRVQTALLDTAGAVAAFAANWFLQSTLLIAAGLGIAWLARRCGAAVQSAIYRTTLAAVLVCPLAKLLFSLSGVSGWSLPMPATWDNKPTKSSLPAVAAVPSPAVQVQDDFDRATKVRSDERVERALVHGGESWQVAQPPSAAVSQDRRPQPHPQAGTRAVLPAAPAPQLATDREQSSFRVRPFGYAAIGIAVVWLLGSSLLLTHLTILWRRLTRLLRAAMLAESVVQEACRQAAALVGVAAPEVLSSPYLASPCVVGWPRRAVLLPEVSRALPLRDVLIHELAHLRRRDTGWHLAARLIEALFFYQPLVWLLNRWLEASAEDVCDDFVVEFGGDRSKYARGLLDIAELSMAPVAAPAVAMVSLRSILARRVTRIMDGSRSLSTRIGNLLLAVVIVGGLMGTLIVGFVGLGQHPSANAEPMPDTTAKEDAKEPAAEAGNRDQNANEPAAKTKAKVDNEPAAENQLRGVVIGADGKAVANAKLYWIRARVHDLHPEPPRLLATTGDDGKFHFAEPPPVEPTVPASWSYMDRIVVVAPGHGFAFTSSGEVRRAAAPPDGFLAALARVATGRESGAISLPAAGEPIRGRLVDVNGRPVAGATVRIRWFNGENDIGFAGDLEARGVANARWQVRVMSLLNVIEQPQLREVLPSATTDADGRFELHDIGQKRLVQLLVQGEGIEATEIVARNEPGEKIVIKSDRHQEDGSTTIYPDEFVCAVGPSKPVEGRVLDLDSDEPIARAVVRAFVVHSQPVSTSREREHFAATTDAQGRFRISGLPIGNGNKLVAFGTGKVAYSPVGHTADTSADGAAVKLDFHLKRGAWAEGRVFDGENDKPFTGEISYYFFRNRELEEAIPGLREAFVDGLYWTNANGEFHVPVLPSRGILGFRYDGYERERDGIDRFPRGFGTDDIAGSEKFGAGKWFPTAPYYLIPENYERLAEVAPVAGQETVRVDMPLFASPRSPCEWRRTASRRRSSRPTATGVGSGSRTTGRNSKAWICGPASAAKYSSFTAGEIWRAAASSSMARWEPSASNWSRPVP